MRRYFDPVTLKYVTILGEEDEKTIDELLAEATDIIEYEDGDILIFKNCRGKKDEQHQTSSL